MSFSNEMSPADYAAINGNNNGWGGFGGDGAWWIIILLLLAGNGGWGGGFGFGGGYEMPYFYNAQTQADVNRGFDNQGILSSLNAIASAVNGGFSDAAVSQCNQTTTLLQTLNANQNATTAAMNSLAMGLQNCCCDNRAGLADLKYTVATENCADRQALNEGIRDVIASNTANTQAILDKLCQQEIDAKNETIANLRQELMFSRGQASQIEQTATLRAGQEAEVDALYNRLSNCPVPTTPVYGRTPIFTCNNGGCGCGNNNF